MSNSKSREDVLRDIEEFSDEYDQTTRAAFEDSYDHLSVLNQHFFSVRVAVTRSDADFTDLYFSDDELDAIEDVLIEHLQECKRRNGKASQSALRGEDDLVNPGRITRHFGTYSKGKVAALDNPKQVHVTDDKRERLNREVREDEYKRDILTGLLMGDGYMKYPDGKNTRLGIEMADEEFLEWVSDELGDIVREPDKSRDAADLAEKNREHGYTVNEENYSDLYTISSVALPALEEFASWYDSGQKRFPDWVELNPTVTKMWYCCDGSLAGGYQSSSHPVIYVANEKDRRDYLMNLFEDTAFSPTLTDGGGGTLQFSRGEAKDFLDWLGDPPAGFEYKWLPEQRPSQ